MYYVTKNQRSHFMNSVDLSSPDNLINWHHPELSQNYDSWNFIKEILAEFINTFGKLKNCETKNVDKLRTRVQLCDTAGVISCDENTPYSFYCTTPPCKRLFIRIANFFFSLLSNKNDDIEHLMIHSSTDGKRFINNLIIEKLTVKNGIGQCTSSSIYARISDFDSRIPKNEWKCDDLKALSGKIKNYLENSVLSAHTTTLSASGPSSNAGQTPQTADLSSNSESTPTASTATPSSDTSSNIGSTPQTSASPRTIIHPLQPTVGKANQGRKIQIRCQLRITIVLLFC